MSLRGCQECGNAVLWRERVCCNCKDRAVILTAIRQATPGLRGQGLKFALSTANRREVLKRMERKGEVRWIPGAGWVERL